MDHDDLLGGDPGPAASRENLEGVLRRHLRRRRRFTGGIAAAVLTVGIGGGAAIGAVFASGGSTLVAGGAAPAAGGTTFGGNSLANPTSTPSASAQVSAPAGLTWSASCGSCYAMTPSSGAGITAQPGTACSGAGCSSAIEEAPLTKRLFERSANGVDVRAFLVDYRAEGLPTCRDCAAQPAVAFCSQTSTLLVEVSDAGAVAEVSVPLASATDHPVSLVAEDVEGVVEGAPMAVLVVRAGTGVHEAAASFASGAKDAMDVVGGVAVLATTLPTGSAAGADVGARANVEALGAAGQGLETFSVPNAPSFAEPTVCGVAVPGSTGVPPGGRYPAGEGGSSGSAGSSPGSTGSSPGSTGSGSTSSVTSPPAASTTTSTPSR